jgi:RNA polymerase sigma-70 factor (ECF subfamily)
VLDDLSHVIGRCSSGDSGAATELVRRFQSQVYGLCYRMLGCRHDAEDVTQESFIRALKSLAHYDRRREFLPWLLAIAGNRCRTLLARRKRRPVEAALPENVADNSPDWQSARNLAEEVRLALAELRPEYRQAFLLFHQHELSYSEIAQTMGAPVGTIKTWVHRGRREMIEFLRRRGVLCEAVHAVRCV